ncbi:MAG: ABC transporter substrate-binding protein [Desulfamplus sp.]|nr:ABC transporter substrate-binding protein [Desulfamplus sp.]
MITLFKFFIALLLMISTENALCKEAMGRKSHDPVTLQLAWKHQFQFAGYYAALHKGFYGDAGVNVTIVEGGDGRFAREALLSGEAQYGVAGAELILHRGAGEPFVVLAPIFQHSPSILLTRADSGISHPQHLMGKRVMMLPENKDADIMAVMLNENISMDQITRLDQTYNLNDLIEGRTDAVTAYLTNEPWHMEKIGVKPHIIHPATYGVDFYSDCLFTTNHETTSHLERVKAFLGASIKGWEYAMDHPEEIIDLLILEYRISKTREHLRFEADAIKGLMFPDLVEIGHMNPGRWRHIADTYAALGMLPPNFPMDDFLYDPDPVHDYGWMKWTILILIGAILIFSSIAAFLAYFNRKLHGEIVERKQAEHENIQLQIQLQQARKMEAIGTLAGGIAHDFNNIMGIILGNAELAMMDLPRNKYSSINSNLNEIKTACLRASEVVRQLLSFARKSETVQIPFRINDIVKDALKLIRSSIPAGIVIKLHLPEKSPVILSDPTQINQIILNLATNAAHAMPRGGKLEITVTETTFDTTKPIKTAVQTSITTADQMKNTIYSQGVHPGVLDPWTELPAGNYVILKVRDTGHGIPTEHMDRIFDPYFTTKDINEGSGFGLSVVHGIVKRHKGAVIVESYEGEGTTFTIFLPRAPLEIESAYKDKEDDISEDGFAGHSVPEKDEAGPVTEKMFPDSPVPSTISGNFKKQDHILFVDDENSITDVGKIILEKHGYRVTAHTNPLEALEKFKSSPHDFDLVITDMSMPEMSGDTLIDEIKNIRGDLPVIVCSGYALGTKEEDMGRLNPNVDAFITKPHEFDLLLSTVGDLVRNR